MCTQGCAIANVSVQTLACWVRNGTVIAKEALMAVKIEAQSAQLQSKLPSERSRVLMNQFSQQGSTLRWWGYSMLTVLVQRMAALILLRILLTSAQRRCLKIAITINWWSITSFIKVVLQMWSVAKISNHTMLHKLRHWRKALSGQACLSNLAISMKQEGSPWEMAMTKAQWPLSKTP